MGLLSFFKKKGNKSGQLNPESKWIVEFVDDQITTKDFDGNILTLDLDKISLIVVETNDTGPLGIDVWWKVIGAHKVLSVPMGATGEKEMLERFQEFPGFDNEQFILAMGCSENQKFLCWKNK